MTDFWTDFFDGPTSHSLRKSRYLFLYGGEKNGEKNDVEVGAIGNTRVEGSEAIKTDWV